VARHQTRRIGNPDHRQLVETFARWHQPPPSPQQARSGGVAPNTFVWRNKPRQWRSALAWLAGRANIEKLVPARLDAGSPADLDRQHALPSFYWAINTPRPADSDVPRPGPAPTRRSARTNASPPPAALLDDNHSLPWRVAAASSALQPTAAHRQLRIAQIDQIDTEDPFAFAWPATGSTSPNHWPPFWPATSSDGHM